MLKKEFCVWILLVLLTVTLLSSTAHYGPGSRPLFGYPAIPTLLSDTQIATNFSIIALPDTQFYSESYPDIFDNQTQWIADNARSMNIVFVTHEGDIVNDYSSLSEWNNANNSISKLDVGNVSYGVLPGNHDGSPGNVANYNTYFNFSRFSGRSWYGGAYQNDNSNNFELFRGGQDDYLIFNLQYQPSDQVLAWANSTLQAFPNRRVIVTTHSYLNVDGTRTDIGQRIWDSLIAPHADRIFLVLCGHNHAEAERQDMVNGNTVYQLLADYQDRANGGNGWLRILQFCPAHNKIYVETYSPYLGSYENDADSQFALNYNMTGAKVIVVPDDYSTIQGAIDAANDGDTIFVRIGKYYENILVHNEVSIIGEDELLTIIDGSGLSDVVMIPASDVSISNLTVQNGERGIYLTDGSSRNRIVHNTIINGSSWGIELGLLGSGSSNNVISGNSISRNGGGIVLRGSNNNILSFNNVSSNYLGIQVDGGSCNTTLTGNLLSNNAFNFGLFGSEYSNFHNQIDRSNLVDGKPIYYLENVSDAVYDSDTNAGIVYLINCANVTLRDLTLTRNFYGVFLWNTSSSTIENVTAQDEYDGVWFEYQCDNEIIVNNTFSYNLIDGIHMETHNSIIQGNKLMNNSLWGIYGRSFNTTISTNVLFGNMYAIYEQGTSNKFIDNDFAANGCGFVSLNGSDDSIFHNIFLNNQFRTEINDYSAKSWDNGYPSGGNYWSDYSGNDTYSGAYQNETGNDGIGDTQHVIDANNTDHYPLMSPWTPPDVAALNITSCKTIVGEGLSANVTVSVENQGNKIEELNATFYANDTFIGSQTFLLTSNNSIIYSSNWDLSSLAKGNYSLSARIMPLEGETDLNDNSLNGSWIFITIRGDLNGDKTVDIYDAVILAGHFGWDRYHLYWDSNADINNDGIIDVYDAIMLAANYGKSWI